MNAPATFKGWSVSFDDAPLPRPHVLAFAGAEIMALEWASSGVDAVFNRLQIDLFERHQEAMNEGFERADALIEAMRKGSAK